MKLSPTQQTVIDAIRDGWELGSSMGFGRNSVWLQKNGLGNGGETKTVSRSTLQALLRAGMIVRGERKYPFQPYKLATER